MTTGAGQYVADPLPRIHCAVRAKCSPPRDGASLERPKQNGVTGQLPACPPGG